MQTSGKNENKAITIYDIAREAGVSPATVSRVLTSNANVRPEKKQKVQEVIEKYNYKPNAFARGLADTKSWVIGLLTTDVRNPFYAAMYVACESAAKEAGYTILSSNSLDIYEDEVKILGKFQEQKVDAIIQIGGSVDDLYTNLEYSEVVNKIMITTPVVITGKLDGTQCHMVRLDDAMIIDLMMEHLFELDHREIAMIGGRMDVASAVVKAQRYKQNLIKYKIDFDPDLLLVDNGYNAEAGYMAMNALLDSGKIPTAVMAINDFTATGVIRSILEHGYRIPQDISIVSQDNTFIAYSYVPSLTSVDFNYEEFGKKLIETAVAVIEGKEVPMLQSVIPKLIIRESTARVCRE